MKGNAVQAVGKRQNPGRPWPILRRSNGSAAISVATDASRRGHPGPGRQIGKPRVQQQCQRRHGDGRHAIDEAPARERIEAPATVRASTTPRSDPVIRLPPTRPRLSSCASVAIMGMRMLIAVPATPTTVSRATNPQALGDAVMA